MRAALVLVLGGLLLAGCGGGVEREHRPSAGPGLSPDVRPRMVAAATPLQCVPYARQLTGLEIRGDAWTWWQSAAGRFARDNRPAVGSVLVLRKTARLRYGHLSVVTGIVSEREILVEHANWLNRGRIHKDIPVRDVSRANDWSAVRVWYVPGQHLGGRTYPAHGFIHPRRRLVAGLAAPSN